MSGERAARVATLVANAGGLVVGSLVLPPRAREVARTARLLGALARREPARREDAPGLARVEEKRAVLIRPFAGYHPQAEAVALADAALARAGVKGAAELGAVQLVELQAEVEATLAAAIGAAAAHAAVRRAGLVAPDEARAVADAYAGPRVQRRILRGFRAAPERAKRGAEGRG